MQSTGLQNDATPSESALSHRDSRPLNGEEYLASLHDGREVWIYGERVADVTAHPAFHNTARILARLYDALHVTPVRRVIRIVFFALRAAWMI